jgi:DNA-binding transcriptional ArsR family regulator
VERGLGALSPKTRFGQPNVNFNSSKFGGIARRRYFVYHENMNANTAEVALSRLAAAIAEPARARMLCALMDGHARTHTELALVAEVSPSTASVHLSRLTSQHLVEVLAQGRHRYFRLSSTQVGSVLESLMVLGGSAAKPFVVSTPSRLRWARTCYDHMAGTLAVRWHDRMLAEKWLVADLQDRARYALTDKGAEQLSSMGIGVPQLRTVRRRMACACVDWGERRPHVGGAVGAALLSAVQRLKWVARDADSRALRITAVGEREFLRRFGISTRT